MTSDYRILLYSCSIDEMDGTIDPALLQFTSDLHIDRPSTEESFGSINLDTAVLVRFEAMMPPHVTKGIPINFEEWTQCTDEVGDAAVYTFYKTKSYEGP